VHRLLETPALAEYQSFLGRESVKRAVERELDRARVSGGEAGTDGMHAIVASVCERLDSQRRATLMRAINATGVIVHTNLGRAPLAAEALAAVADVGAGYSNLEYDLEAGERGSRYARVTGPLRELTGAQDALAVNNCAAAVLLILDTFAKGREVVVARGQLVEIGGGFRLPDVLQRGGATLVEVGTTNKVYVEDYERALSPRTALLLRTHPSNYAIAGFTHDVTGAEMARLGARAGVPVVEDLGSGAPVDLAEYGLPHERTIREALGDGISLVAFSGDKLLGGPQAGIVAGRAELVARLRNNPLLRALRVDKTAIAALAATLQLHRSPETRARIPLYRMLGATMEDLWERARRYCDAIAGLRTVEHRAVVGGGALPGSTLASLAIAVSTDDPGRVAAALRRGKPPVVARLDDGRVLLDLRTIAPEEDGEVLAALLALR